MSAPPFYNTYYRINTNCYDFCNVRKLAVYSVKGAVKWGSADDIAQKCVVMMSNRENNTKTK